MEPMQEYSALKEAFEFYNERLFKNELPPLFISFRAGKNQHGYFSPNRLNISDADKKVHEIALNLESSSRPVQEVLSTLVHELVHLWQEVFGTPGKGAYHNKEWASKMREVGLIPYNTKDPDKDTGTTCSHKIQDRGPFDLATIDLLNRGWKQTVYEQPETIGQAARRKQQHKHKYACPGCDLKVWGKADLELVCSMCSNFYVDPKQVIYLEEV